MSLKKGTIFPQDGKWYFVVKENIKTVIIRELINYKTGSSKLTFGDMYKASKANV